MKTRSTGRAGTESGIALIVVMLVIVVLAVLASAFAYSMKVEAALARNSGTQTELEWSARSVAEMARFLLGESMNANQGVDDDNQFWAGGPMGTNEAILSVLGDTPPGIFGEPLIPQFELGDVLFDYQIEDLERYYNVNIADDFALRQALILMQAEDVDGDLIIGSILDWIDPDDLQHPNGTESEYYERLDPPYLAKNGPIDDMTELLMIRGITPELFWGPNVGEHRSSATYQQARTRFYEGEELTYPNGFANLFTSISASFVNMNTASDAVLQFVPGIDANMANAIIMHRSGPDGIDGTDQDIPFRSVGEIASVVGLPPQTAGALGRVFSTRSATFRVTIKVARGEHVGTWIAVMRRDSPTDVKILTFYRDS